MNFIGIGPMELLVIATLAFFLLGPKKMADSGKAVGKAITELRKQRDELTSLIMDDTGDAESHEGRPSRPKGSVSRSDYIGKLWEGDFDEPAPETKPDRRPESSGE